MLKELTNKELKRSDKMNNIYNILDFETTGLSAEYDRVIEIGVVKVQDHKVIDTFQEFVNPGMRIGSVITNLTGITNAMVKDADKSNIVMPRLNAFLGNELIIAHNASFDSRFYKAEMNRIGIYPSNDFLCSLLLARRMYQELSSHKLGVLCNHLGYVNEASHRALEDAEVTHKIFSEIYEKVKAESSQTNIDQDYLARLSKVPKKKVSSWLRN
jgi:DNA polymerase-3 subunit epsilon